jgi:hypothetical protein
MFSRGSRTSGRHARDDRSRRGQSRPGRSLADELDVTDELGTDAAAGGSARSAGAGEGAGGPAAREPAGPYDASQAPAGVARIDLGSLKIPSVPGVEVRVQANPDGLVQQVFLVHRDSALQLGAFAAPRSESIWDEVREEIRKSLFADGVAAEEVPGDYGTELRARVRTPQGLKDLRFVGVSGPRWLLRAVYQGPAAVDPAQAGPLAECLRGVVVDRGTEAKPVKEPLPLRLSREMAAQLPAAAGARGGPAGPAAGQATNGRVPAGAAPANGAGAGRVPTGGVPTSGFPTSGVPGGGFPGGGLPTGGPPATGATPTGGAPGATPTGDGAPPRRKPSPRPRRQG